MAEWPVEITKEFSHEQGQAVPAGTTISATRTREADGEIHSYIVICPKCGMAGDCVRERWTAAEQDGKLTLRPSILCSCGGHYWLIDGVLREV